MTKDTNQTSYTPMGDDDEQGNEYDVLNVNAPYQLFTGRTMAATYTEQNVPSYQGNPLIEALPPIVENQKALGKALMQQPNGLISDLRRLSVNERIHCVHDLGDQFFQPLPHHLSFHTKFDCMLRRGYVMRNPTQPGFYPRLKQQITSPSSFLTINPCPRRPKAHGFNLIGPSGIGKTWSLESILYLYPQCIDHRVYREQRFTQRQLVWLKMDCPYDGSLRALAISFFVTVDAVLGTNYSRAYLGSRRASVDDLLRDMARVAALHFLGVLAVDEIQVLRAMRSENSGRMLNFFVNLVNTIGVPVLLIGTSKARRLFEGDPRQARRGTGQGAEIWELMGKDRSWTLFLKALFRFQYVTQPVELTDELSATFFDETQGITDLVVKLYVQSQIRAMATGVEKLTSEIVRSVALDSFQMLRPVIVALRLGDKHKLADLEDIYPIWRTAYAREMMQQSAIGNATSVASKSTTEKLAGDTSSGSETDEPMPLPGVASSNEKTEPRNSPRRARPRQTRNVPPASLMGVIEQGRRQDVTPYDALQHAGHIFSFERYMTQEVGQ